MVGDQHSRTEPFEQLVNGYSEYLHVSMRPLPVENARNSVLDLKFAAVSILHLFKKIQNQCTLMASERGGGGGCIGQKYLRDPGRQNVVKQSKLYGILHTVQCIIVYVCILTYTLILITTFQLPSADAHAPPGSDNFGIFRRRL